MGQIYVIRLEIRGLERKMISKVKSQRDCVHWMQTNHFNQPSFFYIFNVRDYWRTWFENNSWHAQGDKGNACISPRFLCRLTAFIKLNGYSNFINAVKRQRNLGLRLYETTSIIINIICERFLQVTLVSCRKEGQNDRSSNFRFDNNIQVKTLICAHSKTVYLNTCSSWSCIGGMLNWKQHKQSLKMAVSTDPIGNQLYQPIKINDLKIKNGLKH